MSRVGDGQTGVAGNPTAVAPGVIITDDESRAIPGITVNFAVTSGGGSIATATAVTDGNGLASTTWVLGSLVGLNSLRASADGVPGSPTTIKALSAAGPPAALSKVSVDPAGSPAGGNIDSIAVLVTDEFGNPVPNQTVAFSVTSGGGSVSPATRATLADGRAAARWILGTTIEQVNTAKATLSSNSALTVEFSTTTTRPVATVRFTNHVIVVDSAQTITPQVSYLDASGNAVSGATGSLTSRNLTVASAGASAATGSRSGQTFLIVTSLDNPQARDSAMLVVSGAGKPAVTMTMPRFDLAADTTFTVSLIVDSRSASVPIGASTFQVVWNPAALSLVSEEAGSANAFIDVNSSAAASGIVRIALASSTGLTGAAEVRRFTFKASAVAGRTGVLSVDVIDMSAATTFANLVAQTVSGSYPVRIR